MSTLSTIGAVVLGLLGIGLAIVALSVDYLGSFRGGGLAPVDSLFVTGAAVGSVVCIVGSIALFASMFRQAKG